MAALAIELVEFGIVGGENRVKSRIATVDFKRADFDLLLDLLQSKRIR